MQGSGIDVVSIERIREAARNGRFLERVFTAAEISYSMSRKDPGRHLAGRFAAKEACMKALSAGSGAGVGFRDIEVVRLGNRPALALTSRARSALGDRAAHLSISYAGGYAFAFVSVG